MENTDEQIRMQKALKKVKAIKGFYKHFAAYLIVNSILIAIKLADFETGERFLEFRTFSTAFFWGIGLGIHAFSVFGTDALFGSDWEERKIKEYMNKENNSREKWE